MAITDWPEGERPREKLLSLGSNALSDAELLAIFLRTGIHGKTAVDLARDLIDHFGGLRNILEADIDQFCSYKGLGPAKFTQLQAVIEMGRRHLLENIQQRDLLQSPQETIRYLTSKLRNQAKEIFSCIFLDSKNHIINYKTISEGSIDTTTIYPRTIMIEALKENAAAIILAHNHPSGDTSPSQDDIEITAKLKKIFLQVDINVLDHIIIGEGGAYSFAQHGAI